MRLCSVRCSPNINHLVVGVTLVFRKGTVTFQSNVIPVCLCGHGTIPLTRTINDMTRTRSRIDRTIILLCRAEEPSVPSFLEVLRVLVFVTRDSNSDTIVSGAVGRRVKLAVLFPRRRTIEDRSKFLPLTRQAMVRGETRILRGSMNWNVPGHFTDLSAPTDLIRVTFVHVFARNLGLPLPDLW